MVMYLCVRGIGRVSGHVFECYRYRVCGHVFVC